MIQKRGRVYGINGRWIEINFDVLSMLETWNSHGEDDSRNDTTLDFPFVLTILLSILSPDDIKTGDFDHEALGFLTGEFENKMLDRISIIIINFRNLFSRFI